jgi:Lsr2
MAQRSQVVFTDDIDGSAADTTIRFAVDGVASEIDLSAVHTEEFRKAVRPFIDAARKAGADGTSRRASTSRTSSGPSGPSPSDVRSWARDQGIEVKDKGRVPAELIVRFQAVKGSKAHGTVALNYGLVVVPARMAFAEAG